MSNVFIARYRKTTVNYHNLLHNLVKPKNLAQNFLVIILNV